MAELKEGVVGGAMNLYFIYKFLRILTTPFASTDAFKLGIIDEKGKILKKKSTLKSIEEKEAYTMFDRLVWKLKRLLEKISFGKTRIASYAAALWLIKEENNFNGTDKELQESFLDFLETDWKTEALILKENYEGDMDKKSFGNLRQEGIDIKKASMKDVIKDFQSSDAPQFKGKSDKKKKEMAIAAKLSKEEVAPHAKVMAKKGESAKAIKKMHPEITDDELEKLSKEEVAEASSDTTDMYALMVKGLKAMPGSPKQKDIIKQINVIRKRMGMPLMKETFEFAEATKLPPHLAKFFDKKGNLKPEVAARIAKGKEKLNWIDVTPKGYGPKEDTEVDEKKVPKIKFKLKQFKQMKPEKKVKSKKSSSSGDREFAFGISRKGGSGVGSGYGKKSGMMFNGKMDEAKGTAFPATIDTLKMIVREKQNQIVMFDKGQARVDLFTASAMVQVYDSLKPKTKKKFEDMIKTKAGFMKSQAFAMKMMEETEYVENIEVAFIEEASLGSMLGKKAKKLNKASSGYDLYHKDFSSAMQHAYDHAKKKGAVVDKKEIDDKVATGPKKPSKGKTNRYELKAGKRTVMIQVANLDNKRYELNMYIEGKEELSAFSKFITEGRPKQDPDYVPGATVKDFNRSGLRALADAQKKKYSSQDIKSIARKYKQNVADAVGGKTWDWEWIITLMNGLELTYDYGSNTTYIKGWRFDKKKAAIHLAKYGNEHETVRDMQGGGGKVQVAGLETAFELIGEQLELKEEFWAVIDKAKGGEVMAVTSDEKDAKSSVKMSNFSKHDYHFGKDPRTLKIVKVMGKHSQKKAEKMIGTKLSYREEVEEDAPANSVAAGNVNLDPFAKKKRKNAKVQWEMFGGQKVFVVTPERFYDSRMGKARYARYEKYVGNDKLGETIRQYGRNNPKNAIILKNSGNGAMLYLKYGRN